VSSVGSGHEQNVRVMCRMGLRYLRGRRGSLESSVKAGMNGNKAIRECMCAQQVGAGSFNPRSRNANPRVVMVRKA